MGEELGSHEFRLQRKRYLRCGEIKLDYSKLTLRNGVKVSLTTIYYWIDKVRKPLREMLKTNPVPSSRY
ncbi:MAG: hypothetical protein ACFFG0_19010 [Candidatus Thorarchaeota archaeon]